MPRLERLHFARVAPKHSQIGARRGTGHAASDMVRLDSTLERACYGPPICDHAPAGEGRKCEQTIFAYRDLKVDYDKDRVLLDTAMQGPLFGFTFRF